MQPVTSIVPVLCLLLITVGSCTGADVFVDTDKGIVKGRHYEFLGKDLSEFLGIPYAKPPLGARRFRHPEPPDNWTDVVDATEQPNSCVQDEYSVFNDTQFRLGEIMWNANTQRSEDCLYLNVWAPFKAAKRPVMIWIYGGGFVTGTATLDVYNGSVLAALENVVVVSMQYRVSSLGFATMVNHLFPANLGLWDQQLALVWVRNNIERFGGDAFNVTLFGESAGAAAVAMHMMSPYSKDLFQRGIMQSASATCPWACVSKEEARTRMLILAKRLNCLDNHVTADDLYVKHSELQQTVYKCFMSKPAYDFIDDYVSMGVLPFQFMPVIDEDFLPMAPLSYLMKVPITKPIMTGFNRNEGSFWLMYMLDKEFFIHHPLGAMGKMQQGNFTDQMDKTFYYYPRYPAPSTQIARDAIIHQYMPYEHLEDLSQYMYRLDQAVGDFGFSCDVIRWSYWAARHNQPVYVYYYTHRASFHHWPAWGGVMHGDEISFVFGEPFRRPQLYSDLERRFAAKVIRYWANFARTGFVL